MELQVLHVYKVSMPSSHGGVESSIDTLCKGTSAFGVKNVVFTLCPKPDPNPILMDGYQVIQAHQNFYIASTGFSISAIKKFQKLALSADIIHYHFPNPFGDLLALVQKSNKPSLVTYHSDIIRYKTLYHLYKPLMHRFLKCVDIIVSTSPNYFATSGTLQKFTDKVKIIPLGIEHSFYKNAKPTRLRYWRERLPKRFFLFLGVLRYYKGIKYLIEAVANTDIQIVIAGALGKKSDLEAYVAGDKLKNVIFLGFVEHEEKLALLSLCYGFVFPSNMRSEAFGVSLLEAASCGKPLISCEIGTGTSFINKHNETGLVIKPASSYELRLAMRYLLDNPHVADRFGKKARTRALTHFDYLQQAKSYIQLYSELLNLR